MIRHLRSESPLEGLDFLAEHAVVGGAVFLLCLWFMLLVCVSTLMANLTAATLVALVAASKIRNHWSRRSEQRIPTAESAYPMPPVGRLTGSTDTVGSASSWE